MTTTFAHAMVRVTSLEESLPVFQRGLGLVERHRYTSEQGRYTMVILIAPDDPAFEVHLTLNHEPETYGAGRNFGHLAFQVDDVYETCRSLQAAGAKVARPPRDGRFAFVRTPDGISLEIVQRGEALAAAEPWRSMANHGTW
jgi:lactoylglutathione lyase